MRLSIIPVSIAALATATTASAQWVSYSDQTATRVSASASLVTGDTQEKDYAWADLDQDGDTDLVIVRKQPFTSSGRFPNVLLMNENGVLTDRTSQYASNANGTEGQPGSSGFLDSTNDRDVVIADINGDGWLDLVTCITLSNGQADYISANRIYINKGEIGGVWQGFIYDDWQRIDHLALWGDDFHRFCSVKAGDVDGDGDVDLYFGDYQQGGSRPVDHNDKLLFNDGTGYFTDATGNMTFQMVESSFGMETDIVDMNGDGKLDIVKADALNAPQAISVSYNSLQAGSSLGEFDTYQLAYQVAAYNFEIGDLNNDGRPDMIVSDDGQDRYVLNNGNAANGTVDWSSTISFSYIGGGDDGFGGNNIIADLDNDGWNDAVIADVDVDISGCGRRCHIFRNLGNAPNVTLQEQIVSGEVLGGITTSDLIGTFDVAAMDINGDGYLDLVIGRCTGTQVYINEPPLGMTLSFVGGIPSMVVPGATQGIQVQATGIGGVTPLSGTGVLYTSINGAGFSASLMSDNGAGLYSANLPVLANCADELEFYVSVQGSDTNVYSDPPAAPAGAYSVVSALGTQTIYFNDFESNSAGWTVQDSLGLTTGSWERADPNGTTSGANFVSPDDDAQAGSATYCMVTQNGLPGGTAGATDVDNGYSDLISPALDYSGTDGNVSFQAWLYGSSDDTLEIAVSNNGTTWVPVQTIVGTPGQTNQWLQYGFRVGDYVTPTSNVRVRFRAWDNGTPSLCDAGVDFFSADAFTCDTCQPTVPGITKVGGAIFSMCGGDLSPGTTTDLAIRGAPAGAGGLLFFDAFLNISPLGAGSIVSPSPVLLGPLFFDANGDFIVPGLPIGGLLFPGFSVYVQAIYDEPSVPFYAGITDALQVTFN